MPAPSHPNLNSAWTEAESLAAGIAASAHLPTLESPLLLDPGEVLHASVEAHGWRHHALDVIVEERRFLAMGGPIVFGLTVAASAIGNRRVRATAERLAAPQWRPLGSLPILATNERLLVFFEGQWAPVWYSAIRQMIPDMANGRLQLIFEDDPPYALCGEWVPYLTVVLTTVLADRHGVNTVASTLLPA